MIRLFHNLWNAFCRTIWGRLAATVAITAVLCLIATLRQYPNTHWPTVGILIVAAVFGELYLEFMSKRRRTSSAGQLQLTGIDCVVMVLFFFVLICFLASMAM